MRPHSSPSDSSGVLRPPISTTPLRSSPPTSSSRSKKPRPRAHTTVELPNSAQRPPSCPTRPRPAHPARYRPPTQTPTRSSRPLPISPKQCPSPRLQQPQTPSLSLAPCSGLRPSTGTLGCIPAIRFVRPHSAPSWRASRSRRSAAPLHVPRHPLLALLRVARPPRSPSPGAILRTTPDTQSRTRITRVRGWPVPALSASFHYPLRGSGCVGVLTTHIRFRPSVDARAAFIPSQTPGYCNVLELALASASAAFELHHPTDCAPTS